MKKSRFTDEQITYALRQVQSGTPPADVCRQLGCSEASFYIWKKRCGGLNLTELRESRQLRDENSKLKGFVADLTLDRHVLQEIVKKNDLSAGRAHRAQCTGEVRRRADG